MTYFIKTISLILLIFSTEIGFSQNKSAEVTNYQVYFGTVKFGKTSYIIIRKFIKDTKPCFLLVNPDDMSTKIVLAEGCKAIKEGFSNIEKKFSQSAYFHVLNNADNNAKVMQDAGITHCLPKEKGINLTIDLCPSSRPLDRVLFKSIINAFDTIERPIPIAIAISGNWIKKHEQDLAWLKELQNKGEVDITWINHTLNHFYDKKLPLKNNFLLNKTNNIRKEILGNEELMIENGLEPSVFFRFPGLISNIALLDSVSNFGLIAIGSDAWLAKGDSIHNGSIVLVHGNGNEPLGVKKFIELIKSKNAEERKRNWMLYDLRKSLDDEAFEHEKLSK